MAKSDEINTNLVNRIRKLEEKGENSKSRVDFFPINLML
jgi:hypothetical protein